MLGTLLDAVAAVDLLKSLDLVPLAISQSVGDLRRDLHQDGDA
jgi:hypothetical protein